MRVEDANNELQDLAARIFSVREWLTGEKAIFHERSGWYKCGTPILVWFYIVGLRARKNAPNSIVVTTTKVDEQAEALGQILGNNMYGDQTPEMVVKSGDSVSLVDFLQFIGRAYKVKNVS